VVIWDRT